MYSVNDFVYLKQLERLAVKAKSLKPPVPKIKYESNEKVIKTLKIHNQ